MLTACCILHHLYYGAVSRGGHTACSAALEAPTGSNSTRNLEELVLQHPATCQTVQEGKVQAEKETTDRSNTHSREMDFMLLRTTFPK